MRFSFRGLRSGNKQKGVGMERLTERELYNGKVCFAKCAQTNCPDKCAYCDIPKEAASKLKEYEDLEENGLSVRIPCKIGDTVYVKIQFDGYAEAEVRDYIYFISCGFCIVVTSEKFGKQNIPFSEFGKSVFHTQEEADAILRR